MKAESKGPYEVVSALTFLVLILIIGLLVFLNILIFSNAKSQWADYFFGVFILVGLLLLMVFLFKRFQFEADHIEVGYIKGLVKKKFFYQHISYKIKQSKNEALLIQVTKRHVIKLYKDDFLNYVNIKELVSQKVRNDDSIKNIDYRGIVMRLFLWSTILLSLVKYFR